MIEIGRTARGYTIWVEDDEVGGKRYWSDEIGGGVVVWSTGLVSDESLEFVLNHWRASNGVKAGGPGSPVK